MSWSISEDVFWVGNCFGEFLQFGFGESPAVGCVCKDPSNFPVATPHKLWHTSVVTPQEAKMPSEKLDLLQGTLDVMVLKTLVAMGPMHGYGIARRIEQVSGNAVLLNQGTIYASLVRVEQRGWIASSWGTSENNRKAKFYAITVSGRRQLAKDTAYWERLTGVMDKVMAMRRGAEKGEPA
jgi:transcriptional regulator